MSRVCGSVSWAAGRRSGRWCGILWRGWTSDGIVLIGAVLSSCEGVLGTLIVAGNGLEGLKVLNENIYNGKRKTYGVIPSSQKDCDVGELRSQGIKDPRKDFRRLCFTAVLLLSNSKDAGVKVRCSFNNRQFPLGSPVSATSIKIERQDKGHFLCYSSTKSDQCNEPLTKQSTHIALKALRDPYALEMYPSDSISRCTRFLVS